MHDIRFIRDNRDAFDAALRNRGQEPLADTLLALDDQRRSAITTLETALARRNAASKEIGAAMGRKDMAAADALKAEVAALKDKIAEAEAIQQKVQSELDGQLASIPNVPAATVPVGKDENDNIELRKWGSAPKFDFAVKQHFELGEALGMMDFEAASRMSGARFVVLKGKLARLERALGQFMLDLHTGDHGYNEIIAPLLVKDDALFGTAQLPKFTNDLFATDMPIGATREMIARFDAFRETRRPQTERLIAAADEKFRQDGDLEARNRRVFEIDDSQWDWFKAYDAVARRLWLIPTSEVTMTNLVREQILDEADLPLRFTGLTPCFRSEAGSAGRDTRGMLRQHQFMKVEMVSITTPEQSAAEHERMTRCAETVLEKLGIAYRTIVLCTGDMGFASQKTYDIEAWLPGQGTYREISSCSVCGDFQARRMQARCRTKDAKGTRFVHTLNGSGIAVGRALIAVMENYQNADGSITVPEALRPYMGGLDRIAK